jgi:hypothetical protein
MRKVIEAKPEGVNYIDWDAHAEIHELPSDDLLMGLSGVSMAQEEDEIQVVFQVGISSQNDPNLFQLRALTGLAYAAFKPETRIDIFNKSDVDSGGDLIPVTWMVTTTPLEILPINRAEIRNVQFMNCTALLNPASLSFSQ